LRFQVCIAAMLAAWSGSVIIAQKITTPEELDKVMKKNQPAMQALQKAMGSDNYAEVKTQLAAVRQTVLDSQTFWIEHKRDDALKFNKDTLGKIDAFEKLVSAESVDKPAATAALKEVGAACRSCHEVYRTRDADNDFILKPGSLDK
jgi:cytochrome c556